MAQAVQSTIFASDDSGFTSNTIGLGVRDCDLIGNRTFGVETGKRGGREEWACRARVLSDNVSGGFNIYPTDAELDWIVERAIGDNIAGYPTSAAEPLETLPGFYMFVDKGDVQTFRYDDLRFNRLVLSGAETQMLNLRCDLVGSSETEVTDVTVGGNTPDCDTTFHLADITLTIGGTAFPMKNFELSIDNQIVEQYENSITRTLFESQRLMVRLRGLFAYRSATKALYRKAIAGDNGATLVVADGTNTYTFTFGNIKVPGPGPTVPEIGEVTMPLEMMAFRTSSAKAISIAKS